MMQELPLSILGEESVHIAVTQQHSFLPNIYQFFSTFQPAGHGNILTAYQTPL